MYFLYEDFMNFVDKFNKVCYTKRRIKFKK